MRRCTGLSPSRTSGSARATMTDMEYSRNERSISSWISIGSISPLTGSSAGGASLPPPEPAPPRPEPRVDCAMSPYSSSGRSDVEETDIFGVGLNEVAPELHVVTHQDG